MIKKSDELRKDVVNALAKGEGDIKRTHLLEVEDFGGYGRLFAKHTVSPGDYIGFHKHDGEQEAYYILKGQALYSDDGNEVIIKEGDFTLCKSGQGHSIKNVGNIDLDFIGLIMKA